MSIYRLRSCGCKAGLHRLAGLLTRFETNQETNPLRPSGCYFGSSTLISHTPTLGWAHWYGLRCHVWVDVDAFEGTIAVVLFIGIDLAMALWVVVLIVLLIMTCNLIPVEYFRIRRLAPLEFRKDVPFLLVTALRITLVQHFTRL